MDKLKSLNNKNVRERFSHLTDEEFIKFSNSRIKNAKRLITRDINILDGNGTINGMKIKVSNTNFFKNRIKQNESIKNMWQDSVNEVEFDKKIKEGLKEAIESKLENTWIEERLYTSKYILSISGGESIYYENDQGEEEKAVSYYIYAHEDEDALNDGLEYSGGGLMVTESCKIEDIDKKLEYIKSFIYIEN